MKEQVKTGLLAVIAILTVVNTAMLASGGSSSSSSEGSSGNEQNKASNVTATKQDRDQNRNRRQNQQRQQRQQQQNKQPQNPPTTIEFQKYEHDFGTVQAGTKSTKEFKFTNTGDKPYVIQNAKGSCGCTVPSYPKKPIAPGESGEIEVSYKPGSRVSGKQTNNVTLTGNTEPRQTKLKITANVKSGSKS